MFRRITFILILALLLTACGAAAPAPTEAPIATEEPAATESPVQPLVPETLPATEPSQTFTPEPTYTPSTTPTETPFPLRMVWDGNPTYLGDSTPGYSFRVTYDPDLWALTSDQFGFPALAHRNIEYCVIAVTSGRGLPANVSIEHDVLYTDNVTFDVGVGFENGVKKFVTYTGGNGTIITGFEVTFQDQVDTCLVDAVTVLSTLRSVPVSQATPQP
jgi:hypothetical protein